MDSSTVPAAIGRYRILRLLGSGAMGEVYLAEDPNIGRQVALKTVRLVGDEETVAERKQRLLREARAAGRLLHPNVVTLFDAGEADGVLYLAFELVEGPNLSQRLRRAPRLTLQQALQLVREVATALEYAHQQGIVHRDVKPSNILLGPGGEAKVADFGIAKLGDQATAVTRTGVVIGSPQYMAPEQIRGEPLDGRADLFSLGVVLYEMLSANRPFDGDTLSTLVFQILSQEPVALDTLRPGLPPRLVRLVHALLAKDRDERIASARQVVEILDAIEQELGSQELGIPAAEVPTQRLTSPEPAPPVTTGTYAPRRAGGWLALVVVAGVAVVAVAGWWLRGWLRPGPEPVPEAVSAAAGGSPEQAAEVPATGSPEPPAPPESPATEDRDAVAAAGSETTPAVTGPGTGREGREQGPRPGPPAAGQPPARRPRPPAEPAREEPRPQVPAPSETADDGPGGDETRPATASPHRGVTLYQFRLFGGLSETFLADDPNLKDNPIGNDSVSSVQVDPGCRVFLFEHADYQGRATILTRDATSLRGTEVGNNALSSLSVSCVDPGPSGVAEAGSEPGAVLYVHADYLGPSEAFHDHDPDLADNRIGDDTVSSVRVAPGCEVLLYKRIHYRGAETAFTADAPDLRGTEVGNDAASSIRVYCGHR